MRNFHLLSAFSLLAIFLTFTSAASVAEEPIKKDFEGPSDAQIKKLSFTKLDAPYPIGDMKKEPKDIGWRHLSKAQSLKDIPYPVIPKEKGKCKIKVKADLSRCTGGAFKSQVVAYPYNEYSTDMLLAKGNSRFRAKMGDGQNYVYREFDLDCGFNGKIFALERPDSDVQYTGMIAFRVAVHENYAAIWITSEVDEETGYPSQLNVPLSYYYFGDSPEVLKNKIHDNSIRGYDKTRLVTTNVIDNTATLVFC